MLDRGEQQALDQVFLDQEARHQAYAQACEYPADDHGVVLEARAPHGIGQVNARGLYPKLPVEGARSQMQPGCSGHFQR
ncbi:hypothetical protein D3C79_1008640 [compost metagenome]